MARNRALLIGVNKYPLLDPRYELGGCVDDAKLMKSVLQLRFGFQPEDFIELYDLDATHKAISSAMDELVNSTEKGDCVYFHFAGHGSQRPSRDATESSGQDSTIMPSDSGRQDNPNRDISDDDIGEWLEALSKKTDNITLVFDCCHSGTITRDASSAKTRGVEAETRSLEEMGLEKKPRNATRDLSGESFLPRSDNYVVFSGCRDDELANEYGIQKDGSQLRHGALTYWLTQSMLAAKPKTTYLDIFEETCEQITSLFPTQHPQIEGRRDRILFGTEHVEVMKYFNLSVNGQGALTFDGGAAHGVVVGSKWDVYPTGTSQTEDIEPIASVTVTAVNAMNSDVKSESADVKLSTGNRCVLNSTPVNIPKLSVDISQLPTDAASALKPLFNASNLVEIATDSSVADAKLTKTDDQWTAFTRDDYSLIPFQAIDSEADHARLINNLEIKAKAKNVFALANPDSQLNVEFHLYRSTDGVAWQKADKNTKFNHGDRAAFEVINNDSRDLFVSVLDIGLTGKVAMFYPPGHNSEKLKAGVTLKFGFDNVRMHMGVPPEHHLNGGRETFKAMISTDETSFDWMRQGGTRSLSNNSMLHKMMEQSLQGNNTRDPLISWGEPADDWQGLNCSFDLSK